MIDVEVKVQMLKKHLTQQKMADRLGVTQPFLYWILSGKCPGYAYRSRIAAMLGMKKGDIFPKDKRIPRDQN